MENRLLKSVRMRPYFGTYVEIKLYFSEDISNNINESKLDQYWQEIWQICQNSEKYWSFFDSHSYLSQFNNLNQNQEIILDKKIAEPLRLSQVLFDKTFGLFNPDIHQKNPNIHFEPIQNGQWLIKNLGGNQFDLGGIAKGAAIDLVCDFLQEKGNELPDLQGASVNAGGDIRVFGDIAELISIRLPHDPTQIQPLMSLESGSIASSAHYGDNKAVIRSDSRGIFGSKLVPPYHVSVRAPRALYADALTKIVIASGDAQHPILAEYGAMAIII